MCAKKRTPTLCKRCLETQEPPVRLNKRYMVPKGVCHVCYVRYGKYILATCFREEKKNEI